MDRYDEGVLCQENVVVFVSAGQPSHCGLMDLMHKNETLYTSLIVNLDPPLFEVNTEMTGWGLAADSEFSTCEINQMGH